VVALVGAATILAATGCADPQTTDSSSTAAPTTATESTPAPDDEITTSAPPDEPGEPLVLDLVDADRPTAEGASSPGAPDRTLTTTVRLPPGTEPAPLIVFAHGLSGHPDVFTQLLAEWAAAGFVVAAPAFPLTNREVPDAWENWWDVQQQPGDMTFVTDQLLAANDDPSSPLHGRIDPERIGFGGLSLGGATTYLAGLNQATRDPRVDAAMVLDGVAFHDDATDTFLEPSGVPALVAHCDGDPLADLQVARDAYALLAPPKYLVVLHGECHAEAFEDTPHALDAVAPGVTTAFWQAYLGDGEPQGLAAVLHDAGDQLEWESAPA
jgi:dienelactone hydrolase